MDLKHHLRRQIAFSKATYGPGERRQMAIDHIKKELDEVSQDGDPREWVDLVLLSLDGLWRSLAFDGDQRTSDHVYVLRHNEKEMRATWNSLPELVCLLIEEKQCENEERNWPDWRTSDPNKALDRDRDVMGAASW